MEERPLGKTGIKIKRIGFGGIPIQRISEEEAITVVRGCYDLGINFFDTARAYTTSEFRIGKALRDVRNDVFLATKTVKRTRVGLLEDLETSLKNLGTSWIDLYQLHMVSKLDEWEVVAGEGGALKGLYEARDAGKINHIGITSHNPELMVDVINENIFETMMITFNYLTPNPAAELLPLCRRKNVGTIAMKPMGGGALSDKETALRYVLNHHDIDVAIPGMMSLEEAARNIETGSKSITMTDKDWQTVERDKVELGNEFCRGCDYCKPCPQEIPISFVLRAENQLIRLSGWGPRFEKQIPEANYRVASCLKCGECEKRCPYQLPIRELLPKKMESLMRRYDKETNR